MAASVTYPLASCRATLVSRAGRGSGKGRPVQPTPALHCSSSSSSSSQGSIHASTCMCLPLPYTPLPAGRTMYQFHFRIPPYYTLLVRSLSVLEVRLGAGTTGMPSALHNKAHVCGPWHGMAWHCIAFNALYSWAAPPRPAFARVAGERSLQLSPSPPAPIPCTPSRASRWPATPTTRCLGRPTPGLRAACSPTPRPSCAGVREG